MVRVEKQAISNSRRKKLHEQLRRIASVAWDKAEKAESRKDGKVFWTLGGTITAPEIKGKKSKKKRQAAQSRHVEAVSDQLLALIDRHQSWSGRWRCCHISGRKPDRQHRLFYELASDVSHSPWYRSHRSRNRQLFRQAGKPQLFPQRARSESQKSSRPNYRQLLAFTPNKIKKKLATAVQNQKHSHITEHRQ